MKRPIAQTIIYYIIVVSLSLNFSLGYMQFTAKLPPFIFRIDDYLNFKGTLPFQYRVLPAILFHFTTHLLNLFGIAPMKLGNTGYGLKEVFFLAQNFVAIAVSIILMHRTIMRTQPGSASLWSAFLLPCAAYFFFGPNIGQNYYYPYDITSLMFSTALLYCAVSDRNIAFLGIFFLASINKETSIIGLMLYLAWNFDRLSSQRVFVVVGCAVILFATRLYLYHHFKALNPPITTSAMGPGNFYENQFFNNLKAINVHSVAIFSLFAGALYLFYNDTRSCVLEKWQIRFIHVMVMAVILLFLVGNIRELRVFGELLPPAILLLMSIRTSTAGNRLPVVSARAWVRS